MLGRETSPRGLTRRELLARGGGVALGVGFLGADAASSGEPARAASSGMGWGDIRRQFGLDPHAINLTAWLLASHPRPVHYAIERHRAALNRNARLYLDQHEGQLEVATRVAAGEYLGVSRDEVALTDSTTMALGLLYGGLRLRPGQELLTTTHDFYSTHEALRLRAERDGATLHKATLYRRPDRASVDEILSSSAA